MLGFIPWNFDELTFCWRLFVFVPAVLAHPEKSFGKNENRKPTHFLNKNISIWTSESFMFLSAIFAHLFLL